DRFATAEQLRAALDADASGTGFRAAPRTRVRVFVAASIVVAAAALGAWWSRGHQPADPRRSLIVFPFEHKTGDPPRDYLAGAAALQRFQIDSARVLLTHAVSLDSDFAIAYIRLRDVDEWSGPLGSDERRNAYISAAERHAASLPPRLRALVAFHRAFGAHD